MVTLDKRQQVIALITMLHEKLKLTIIGGAPPDKAHTHQPQDSLVHASLLNHILLVHMELLLLLLSLSLLFTQVSLLRGRFILPRKASSKYNSTQVMRSC